MTTPDKDGKINEDTARLFDSSAGGNSLGVSEAHLVVLDGERAGVEVPCGSRPLRIGSAPDNDLTLPDPSVSRYHALVESSPGGLIMRDLGSTNGTFVSDVRVREIYLRPGNLVRLGRTTLRLEILSRREGVPPANAVKFGRLVGRSRRMRQLFTLLEWIAPTDAAVLITGPTGTGKEMVARSIHENSPRRTAPFVVLDCASVDQSLISSELFGHEIGAFTGAMTRRSGVFEQAHTGTVFLDEVGEMPLDLQPKLLRVLDTRELRRLGGNANVPLDVRVLAATNRPLPQMVSDGKFRSDLYYRLCQVQIELPALDDRKEDIPLLVESLLQRLPPREKGLTMDPQAVGVLWGSSFPGNVRQLRNIVERAAMVARGPVIEKDDLMMFGGEVQASQPAGSGAGAAGPTASAGAPGAAGSVPPPARDVHALLDAEERQKIEQALLANGYILVRTARALGIALNTLKSRMHRLKIPIVRRTVGPLDPGPS